MTTATLRKHGHSTALTLPKAVLDALDVSAGGVVSLTIEDGRLIVEPQRKPRYSLDELLAGCDELPMNAEWDAMPPVGSEAL